MKASHFLSLKSLPSDQNLSALFSSDLAHRYHALPVAIDRGQVTIAMAHPEDEKARQGISTAVGRQTCFVQADPIVVDVLIEKLWPSKPLPVDRTIYCSMGPQDEAINLFVRQIATLLGTEFETRETDHDSLRGILDLLNTSQWSPTDLVIFRNPEHSILKRLVLDSMKNALFLQIPASILVLNKKTIWPIEHLLLIVESGDEDEASVQWTLDLAQRSAATVTLLPLISSPPPMYASLERALTSAQILKSGCPLGKRLRKITHQMEAYQIQGHIKIRHEPAEQQVRCELLENKYSLIVVNNKPKTTWRSWIMAEMINPLLHWANIPLLIAKERL